LPSGRAAHPFVLGRKDAKAEQGNFQVPARGLQKIPLHPQVSSLVHVMSNFLVIFMDDSGLFFPCLNKVDTRAVGMEYHAGNTLCGGVIMLFVIEWIKDTLLV